MQRINTYSLVVVASPNDLLMDLAARVALILNVHLIRKRRISRKPY